MRVSQNVTTSVVSFFYVLSCFGGFLPSQIHASADVTGRRVSFRAALEAAWQHDPVRQELSVNATSARARALAARSWFAGGPTFSGSYYDDRAAGTHLGYVTWEGTLTVPLWLPGQGSATEAVAQADESEVVAQVTVARMTVAVRVLQQAEARTLAKGRLTVAKAIAHAFKRMVFVTQRAVTAGEGTQADLQAVCAQYAASQTEIALADAAYESAVSAEATLLGVDMTPDLALADARWLARTGHTDLANLENRDPRVVAARRDVAAAQAQVQLVRHSYMPNPEVGLMALNQGQYASPWSTQIGMTVRVPLPSAVQNAPIRSAAQDRLAAATRAEITARRAVHDELIRVIATLNGAKRALDQSQIGATLTLKRADALEHAWTLGETPLIEAIRARAEAWHALLTRNQAEVAFHSAVIRLCIATGTLP